ncbi:MAG: PEP-CTERM sorting domain-containing protein [Phycisphaerae bacterium]
MKPKRREKRNKYFLLTQYIPHIKEATINRFKQDLHGPGSFPGTIHTDSMIVNPIYRRFAMTRNLTLLTAATGLALLAGSANAATVTTLGTQADMTDWRTSSVAKTYDPDGDNILGTDGYYLFGAAGENTTGVNNANGDLSGLPSYLGVSSGLTSAQFAYASIDNPVDGSPADIVSGTTSGKNFSETLIATITFSSGVPSDLVMTLMNDNTNGDPTAGFDIRASDGTTVLATVSSLARNDTPDWHSFNLSGITDGDELQVWGLADGVSNTTRTTLLGGVTFDVVPEPGSLALLAVGGLLIARRRRA